MVVDAPLDVLSAIRQRLDSDPELATESGLFVLAALDGEEALDEAVAGGTAPEAATRVEAAGAAAASVHLTRLTVEGFRGIGPASEFVVPPGPGLTLVVGRNGSGKSSFAEALELLLTGTNQRWAARPAVWRQDWRNLHHAGEIRISAQFATTGEPRSTTVERTWAAGEKDLEAGSTRVQRAGEEVAFEALGWARPLERFRPFLPYNELGAFVESRPSDLFDVLSAALGLERAVDAGALLRAKVRDLRKRARDASAARQELLDALGEHDDERAAECAGALAEDPPDLDRLELVLEGQREEGSAGRLSLLREIEATALPARDEIDAAAAALETAHEAALQVAGTDAGRAREIAATLDGALALHAAHGDQPCPVCGGTRLDGSWRARAEAQAAELREQAEGAVRAERELEAARADLFMLVPPPPPVLARLQEVEIDGASLREAWGAWADHAEAADATALARDVLERHAPLAEALAGVRRQAAAEAERLEDAWRPLAARLREALPGAREGERARRALPAVEAAQAWLDGVTAELRELRFRPIADDAQEIWSTLQQRSTVVLNAIALEGEANRRRVALRVTIDGVAGAALGVMSQGELHSLALALFLPRVMRAETPFDFVIIDDPVQAMDPARIDGLARVLERVAEGRQVVVFTHDDRLHEAVRRLQIAAHVVEVTRGPGSSVSTRVVGDPVGQYLDDARALARTPDLPPEVAERVIPGFCRHALEAAATEVVRRRRIGRGEAHGAVAGTLERASTLLQKLSLALWDEDGRAGEVMRSVGNRWGPRAADAVGRANRGSHGGVPQEEWAELVEDTGRVAAAIRALG